MIKKITVAFFASVLGILLISFSGYAVDYPHAEINCTTCHYIHGGAPWDHPAQNIDDTYYNNLCWYCHTNNPDPVPPPPFTAPYVKTHSSLTTDTRYGTWSVECRVCHEPHKQVQFWTYGSSSYLFTGVIDAYVSGDPTSTLTRSGANWTQDEWVGMVVFVLTSPSFSSVIISNTSDTLTLQGPIYAVLQPGTTQFAIVYGGLINDIIDYQKSSSVNPPTNPPTTPISASVKFFRATGPDSFADGVSPQAICEVCHTQTTYHKNNGTGLDHNPATRCTECHLHTEGFKASCTSCHGIPPVDAATLVQRPVDLITGSTTTGAHSFHVNVLRNGCNVCHAGSTGSGVQHMNGHISLGFSALNDILAGGAYGGQSGVNYDSSHAGTVVSNNGTKLCSSIYCHSDGTSVSTGVIPARSSSPAWDSSGPLACTACHGFPPSYPNGQPKANSHMTTSHRQSCNFCHYATTTDGSTITNLANHANANGVYNVDPDPLATFHGVRVSFNYSYEQGGGTCSNVSCHGGTGLVWGQTDMSGINCTLCHTAIVQSEPGQNHHSGTCLTCHDTGAPDGRALHDGTPPSTANSACLRCHMVINQGVNHHVGTCVTCHTEPGVHQFGTTNTSCAACHLENMAAMNHPHGEGTPAECVTCHMVPGTPINVVNTCSQCHNPAIPGAPVIPNDQMGVYAANMHNTKPTADFNWTVNNGGNFMIDFNATPSACPAGYACTYNWDFGDGNSGSGKTITYTYSGAGPWSAMLTVQTNANVTDSKTKYVTAQKANQPPTCSAFTPALAGKTVSFTDASSDDNLGGAAVVSVNWGDGSGLSTGALGSAFSHTYTLNGTFTITKKVTDFFGLNCTTTASVTIASGGTPTTGTLTLKPTGSGVFSITYMVKLAGLTKASGTVADNAVLPLTLNSGTYNVYLYYPTGKACTFTSGSAYVVPAGGNVDVTPTNCH